ncbi:MAG: hypothetical protein JKY31_13135 [Rhodobacteraceae bacterium]|nr:hypothetical protein [Paracoccaceae bacterium]
MKRLEPYAIAAAARHERKAVKSARPRDGMGERPRGQFVECVLTEGDQRITFVGHSTHAIPLYGMAGLDKNQRAIGVIYGAMVEELNSGGVRCVSIEAMPSGGGGAGPEGAVDRRFAMRAKIVLAQKGLHIMQDMTPQRATRGRVDKRQSISARAMMDAICLEGQDMASVLRAYGWTLSGNSKKQGTVFIAHILTSINLLWGGEARGTGRRVTGLQLY